MKKVVLLSIIIPAYNSDKYIGNILDKIMKSKEDDIEVIVVDDGSTDQTKEIVKKWENVIYYYQQNQGVSVARNKGLEISSGNYIWFVDSDDDIPNETLHSLINLIKENKFSNVDIFQSYYYIHRNNRLIKSTKKIGIKLSTGNYNSLSLCSNIIRRQFIFDHKVKLSENLKYTEDMDFMLALLKNADFVVFVDFPIYIYNQGNDNSATSKITFKRIEDELYFINKWEKQKSTLYICKSNLMEFLSYQFYILIAMVYSMKSDNLKIMDIKDIICQKRYLLKHCNNIKGKFIRFLIFVLGEKITFNLLSFWLKFRY